MGSSCICSCKNWAAHGRKVLEISTATNSRVKVILIGTSVTPSYSQFTSAYTSYIEMVIGIISTLRKDRKLLCSFVA